MQVIEMMQRSNVKCTCNALKNAKKAAQVYFYCFFIQLYFQGKQSNKFLRNREFFNLFGIFKRFNQGRRFVELVGSDLDGIFLFF